MSPRFWLGCVPRSEKPPRRLHHQGRSILSQTVARSSAKCSNKLAKLAEKNAKHEKRFWNKPKKLERLNAWISISTCLSFGTKVTPLTRLPLVWAFPNGRCADCGPKGSKPDPAADAPVLLISMLPICTAVGRKDARMDNACMKSFKKRAILALLVRSIAT